MSGWLVFPCRRPGKAEDEQPSRFPPQYLTTLKKHAVIAPLCTIRAARSVSIAGFFPKAGRRRASAPILTKTLTAYKRARCAHGHQIATGAAAEKPRARRKDGWADLIDASGAYQKRRRHSRKSRSHPTRCHSPIFGRRAGRSSLGTCGRTVTFFGPARETVFVVTPADLQELTAKRKTFPEHVSLPSRNRLHCCQKFQCRYFRPTDSIKRCRITSTPL